MDPHKQPATILGTLLTPAQRGEKEEATPGEKRRKIDSRASRSEKIAQAAKGLPTGHCGKGFPHDADFPQLSVATDPQRMRELFRNHLRPVPGRACQIEECQPYRFRCRQSAGRCVLQFTLRVMEPGTGRQWNQWVTGLVYSENWRARRLLRELAGVDRRMGIPETWLTFEPVAFIPDLQMLVQVFPW